MRQGVGQIAGAFGVGIMLAVCGQPNRPVRQGIGDLSGNQGVFLPAQQGVWGCLMRLLEPPQTISRGSGGDRVWGMFYLADQVLNTRVKTAGVQTGIQLGRNHFFPCGAAGAGRAGQAEYEGMVGDAGDGARLDGGQADFFRKWRGTFRRSRECRGRTARKRRRATSRGNMPVPPVISTTSMAGRQSPRLPGRGCRTARRGTGRARPKWCSASVTAWLR